ncbi:MAG: hypothetical protein K9M98_13000 [Cephaloticoccus sp.]|nr:hypothetical protein [Cephaloticoccus sp.]MCF7761411.1 hypothetical protein [Cephaloticoccus sp.]
MPRRPASYSILAALLLLASCREARVAAYRVPKETPMPAPATTPSQPDMASTSVPTASGAGLTWTAPADWEVQAPAAMRRGSYLITGTDGSTADLSITAFPGDVGGDLANVNRWRGQIQLPPLTMEELSGLFTELEARGLTLKFVDLANPQLAEPMRILGGLVSYQGNTWFFKLMGPAALVAREKPAFVAFLESVKAP